MSNRDKILEKLRKLFALGQSPNQHEAELAMAKANTIMQEHQISMTDIDLKEAGEMSREDVTVAKGEGAVRHWVYKLARASAQLYDGECASSLRKSDITFIGTSTDIEAMKMTFVHLFKSWQSIVEYDLRKAKELSLVPFVPRDTMLYKQGHGVGYAQALSLRVYELVKIRQQKVQKTVTGNALVVVKDQALSSFMKKAGYNSTRAHSSSGSHAGQFAGLAAGRAVPLGGVEQRKSHMIGGR